MKTSFLFLAEGFEEVEALMAVDVMRRAGMDVKTVSINDQEAVTGAHHITVTADLLINDIQGMEAEWLILPGGLLGATNLHNCATLSEMLVKQAKQGKIAAICASPAVVLAPLGLLDGKEATCYPGFEAQCPNARISSDMVVASDRLITGKGPAAATEFALAIVANSKGEAAARTVAEGMLVC